MIIVFDPHKESTGISAARELEEGGVRLVTCNPEVFHLARERYEAGGFGELIMVAGGRAYVAEPDGTLLEFPNFEKILDCSPVVSSAVG